MSRSRVCSSVGQSAPLIRVRPEVRIFPDPPFWGSDLRGHSSAGRAPALQAGGRRFDPDWLHQVPLHSPRDTTPAPRRKSRCTRGLMYRSNAATLFKNLNLGMTPRNELISTCDSKACRIRKRYQLIDFIWSMTPERLGLYGQANKRTWWMPWR